VCKDRVGCRDARRRRLHSLFRSRRPPPLPRSPPPHRIPLSHTPRMRLSAPSRAARPAAAAPAAPVPRPALARVEAHPLLPQRKLVGVCRRKGVPVVAGGALGGAGGEVRGHPVVAAVARDVQKSPVEVR